MPDLATKLNVPYIHQKNGTALEFNGEWACGPTSATMVVAAYGLIDPRSENYGPFGWYVSNKYTNKQNFTFQATEPDPSGRSMMGAYGYCVQDGLAQGQLVAQFLSKHGLKASSVGPDQNRVINELKSGKPVIIGGTVQGFGHVTVFKGLDGSGKFFCNDPYRPGEKIYSWADVSPVVWMGVVEQPLGEQLTSRAVVPLITFPSTEDMSGISFQAGDFGPGATQWAGVWVRARPSRQSDHLMTLAAKGTLIKFDGSAEDLNGEVIQGGTRWYHIKPGQTDSSGQTLRGWVHSKMIDA